MEFASDAERDEAPGGSAVSGRGWRSSPQWPVVDVVMPVRDAATSLRDAVASVTGQEYPGTMRVFLAIAPSSDATEDVAADLVGEGVEVLSNPEGTTPAGLNRAIRAGTSPVVLRVDAHSRLAPGYVRRAVELLRTTGAGNVGGRQVPVAGTRFEAAVAAATSSWLGTGGAAYRTGTSAGPVDTVYLGVFDRRAIEEVGLFDEGLIRNQDYELNIRLRQAGHLVWFDPELEALYRPRGSVGALARQYFEYGRWKADVLRRYPGSMRLRQLLPPLAVAASTAGLLGAMRRPIALALPAGYLGLVTVGAIGSPARRDRHRVAATAVVIHWSWSAGIFYGLTAAGRVR